MDRIIITPPAMDPGANDRQVPDDQLEFDWISTTEPPC